MLRSFCVKTNNNNILDNLIYEFNNSQLDEVFISKNSFKNYKNVIIHYKADDLPSFYAEIAGALTSIIVEHYEPSIIKNILISDYFYFSEIERKEIFDYCIELLNDSIKEKIFRENIIFSACFDYIENNKYMILDGFVNFRLKKYIKEIDEIADLAVDKYVLEKEYNEFISLLKLYINSKEPEESIVHLIYQNEGSTLLNSEKKIIDTTSNIFDAKYLSDISFSSNDYALNALLNLLPEKIYIHLIDSSEDEFIETLKLIFENRVNICTDCPICNLYKLSKRELLHKATVKE